MALEFTISIGTENIQKEIDPQELIRMHKMVAPSVGPKMIENWGAREKEGDCKYFCASIKDPDRNPPTISMVSGIIKDENLVIMNSAVQESERQKGYLSSLIGKTIVAINEKNPEVTNFHGMFSTGKEVPKELDTEYVLKRVTEASQEIYQEQEKNLGSAFSSSIQALQQNVYTTPLGIEQKAFYGRHPNIERFENMIKALEQNIHPGTSNSPWGAKGINITPFAIKDDKLIKIAKEKSSRYPTEEKTPVKQEHSSTHQISHSASGGTRSSGF